MEINTFILACIAGLVTTSVALDVVEFYLKRKIQKEKPRTANTTRIQEIALNKRKVLSILKALQRHFEEIEDYEQAQITQRMIKEIEEND